MEYPVKTTSGTVTVKSTSMRATTLKMSTLVGIIKTSSASQWKPPHYSLGNNGNPASVSLSQGCTFMPGSRNRKVDSGQQNLQKAESHVLSVQDNLRRE